jgi:protein-tyrosine phosphatase
VTILAHPMRSAAATATSAILIFSLSGAVLDYRAEAHTLAPGYTTAIAAVTPTSTVSAVVSKKIDNFRDALTTGNNALVSIAEVPASGPVTRTSSQLKYGVLWRSGKLSKASAADRLVLAELLAGGTIIDLRTKSVAKKSPDPKLVGVKHLAFPMSASSYRKFVSDSGRRKAIAQAISAVAESTGPVLIHCTLGRDRTGWTVAMIYYALGFSDDVVKAEFLLTPTASKTHLAEGLAQAKKQYGSVQGYLTKGLGLTDATVSALRAKLVA